VVVSYEKKHLGLFLVWIKSWSGIVINAVHSLTGKRCLISNVGSSTVVVIEGYLYGAIKTEVTKCQGHT